MRTRLVVLICGALTLGAAAPAHALKAYIDSRPDPGDPTDWLVVKARPGEKNFVVIDRDPFIHEFSVAVTELGVATTGAGPGCTKVARLIDCPHQSLVQLEVSLGDGHDTALIYDNWNSRNIYAGGGNDRITYMDDAPYQWGPAQYVYAGPGRDNIDVRNNDVDIVDCGSGADVVEADPIDWLTGC